MVPSPRTTAAGVLAVALLAGAAACGGDDDGAAAGPEGPVTEITITSPDLSFDIERFEVPAGEEVRVTYVNDDRGVQHNIHFDTGRDPEPVTPVVVGPETQELLVTLVEGDEVTYVCDVHPAQMRGTVTAA